jgi:hypothetical protein
MYNLQVETNVRNIPQIRYWKRPRIKDRKIQNYGAIKIEQGSRRINKIKRYPVKGDRKKEYWAQYPNLPHLKPRKVKEERIMTKEEEIVHKINQDYWMNYLNTVKERS